MEEGMSRVVAGEAASPASETPEAPRRGRGRPRKQPQEPVNPDAPKRPRGRPKGSKNKAQRATPKVEPLGERRPRGRPRKWPQKTTLQEQQQLEGKEAGPAEDQPMQMSPPEREEEEEERV